MNIKKVIAREGLVLLGIIALSIVVLWGAGQINKSTFRLLGSWEESPVGETEAINKMRGSSKKYPQYSYQTNMEIAKINRREIKGKLFSLGWFILVFGYPIYLLSRFVTWAIKVIRRSS